jgi:lysine 2,3-aminomutase
MTEEQSGTLLKKSFVQEIEKVEVWEELLKKSIVDEEQLDLICRGNIDQEKLRAVIKKYPMRINPYYLSLIKKKDDAIWKQCIPDVKELDDPEGFEDPLCEERDSPVPGLTHRYPDRVLFLVCNQCAMYCRFCTRKRKVGDPFKRITKLQILKGMDYIREHSEIRDVLLSGGDPLLLSDSFLEWILKELRKIPHIEIIRIGTRVPCALPQRITQELCEILKKYHPLYVNVHFAHPNEITEASEQACGMLANCGIPLSSQTVLLKGVNDNPEVMKKLMQELIRIRVRPYYIYQADMTKGINHFRTRSEKGIEIIRAIQGWTSGLAVPHFVIDTPGGGGKIPILPNYVISKDDNKIVLKNYSGKTYTYVEHC